MAETTVNLNGTELKVDEPEREEFSTDTRLEGYERDRGFGDSIMSDIQLIIGQYGTFFNDTLDRRQNTDLGVINSRWAIRIRSKDVYDNPRFREDVSIRLITGNGHSSEYDKIKSGCAWYMFYGFMDLTRDEYKEWLAGNLNKTPHLFDWAILDLRAFRKFILDMDSDTEKRWLEARAKKHRKPDNVTCIYFNRNDIPDFVLTKADDWKQETVNTWIKPLDPGQSSDPSIIRAENCTG